MAGSSAFSWLLGRGGARKSGKNEAKRGEAFQAEAAAAEELGVTEQLREFVRSFRIDTFKEFRLPTVQQDDPCTGGDSRPMDHSSNNNVQKDLTEWQERHALLVLSTVKEISTLRYVLCPRHLNEKDFWQIYFLLVKSYVAPYELRAIRKAKLKTMVQEGGKSVDGGAVEVEMSLAKQVECSPSPAVKNVSDAC